MEAKFEKVLDTSKNLVVGLKRKRMAQYAASWSPMRKNKLIKQRKSDGCRMNCGSNFGKTLLKYYSNFMKTALPQRIMFYLNGEWTDFPEDLVDLVKKDFQVRKSHVEVELNNNRFMIDFLHMKRVDLKTGIEKPIAWIDEAGKCFFPEIFSGDTESHNRCGHECSQQLLFSEPRGSHDIKLQLEIDVNDVGHTKLKECSGESNPPINHLRIDKKHASDQYAVEVEDSCNKTSDAKMDNAVGENQQMEGKLVTRIESVHGTLNFDSVQNMFISNMSPFISASVLEVYQGSSSSMQARLDLFQKQVEITSKYRADANVRFAWLASPKEALSSIMKYGLGCCGTSQVKLTYGHGVHLTAANFPYIRLAFSFLVFYVQKYYISCKCEFIRTINLHISSDILYMVQDSLFKPLYKFRYIICVASVTSYKFKRK